MNGGAVTEQPSRGGPLWRVKMGDASLRNIGRVCLQTVTEGTDLLVEERDQTSQRR